mmetsp:Transcript_6733/g.10654  ORF Transcript_6733/g.10654 Transcript_6733/m.10654 type:complete len:332 (+) Transcript_6733:26-1021(+)
MTDIDSSDEKELVTDMNDIENQEEEEAKGLLRNNEDSKSSSKDKTLPLLIAAWYASSVVCTNTSKSLKLPGTTLAFCQMLISTICASLGIVLFKLDGVGKPKVWPARKALTITVLLSFTFCAGFITLNISLGLMHVSSVMTARAAEPVATWLLGLFFLPNEKTPMNAVLCLVPIVLGAGLSAVAPGSNMNASGFCLVMLCNVCFSLRTIVTKLLKSWNDIDNYNLFLQLCILGSLWQGVILITTGVQSLKQIVNIPILLLNGVTFYLYMQLSWVVMSRVGAVTHSVCNSLRRPVMCAAGWLVFGGMTSWGIAGAMIATAGTMLYAREKQRL